MRALRDFNTPKIVTDDVPIFMGLIGDLFPALDVPRKRDMDFEAEVKKAVIVSLALSALVQRLFPSGMLEIGAGLDDRMCIIGSVLLAT